MKYFVVIFIVSQICDLSTSFPVKSRQTRSTKMQLDDTDGIMRHLHKYGYLKTTDDTTEEQMKTALIDFQSYAGINTTGEMDETTLTMMNHPRCGMSDKVINEDREKRYTYIGRSSWNKRKLYYRINSYTEHMPRHVVQEKMENAAALWSETSGILIKPAKHGHTADINIYFSYIDGKDGILGFAYNPTNGTIQFDASETWTSDSSDGVNFYQIAVHEMGHSLGLGHSELNVSVMYSYYLGYNPKFGLHMDDIRGIKSRAYGQREIASAFSRKIMNPLCDDSKIDAAFTTTDDGCVYFIRRNFYWKLTTDFQIMDGPNLITDEWTELPEDIHTDSVVTLSNNITYFFSQKYMWKFDGKRKVGNSKLISKGFHGIPDDIDAAFVWSGSGNFYFFKGDQYWRYDPYKPLHIRVRSTYPQPISKWNGLPNNLDTAVSINGATYFFKDHKYYKYNDLLQAVEKGYPKNIATDLLGCDMFVHFP